MRMRCISRCQFKGDIVRVGEVIDMDAATLAGEAVAKTSFVPEDPAAARRSASSGPVVAGLTRRQAVAKLASAKVPVPDDADDAEVAKRFNEAFDAKKAHALA